MAVVMGKGRPEEGAVVNLGRRKSGCGSSGSDMGAKHLRGQYGMEGVRIMTRALDREEGGRGRTGSVQVAQAQVDW